MASQYGEDPNGRQVIEQVARRLERGGLSPELAQQRAREARLRNEARDAGETPKPPPKRRKG